MAPNRENPICSYNKNVQKRPPTLSMESLQRTISDISYELRKETIKEVTSHEDTKLPPISEVEDAKCECCGLSEECTTEYINRIRDKFLGKLICGLCAEAVNEEMMKNGGKQEVALNEHINACVKFNRIGRSYPVLYQAEAIKEILRKSSRAKSVSPRDNKGSSSVSQTKLGLGRSSSCMPALTKEI